MKINVKQYTHTERLIVHEHDLRYLSSVKVSGGRKALYVCTVCGIKRTGKEFYGYER